MLMKIRIFRKGYSKVSLLAAVACILLCANLSCNKEDDTFANDPPGIQLIDLSEVDIIAVFQTGADIAVEIDDEEVGLIDELGIVWSRAEAPALGANEEGRISTDIIVEEYIGQLTGLAPGTTYYFRAYAQTKDSLFYSMQQSITTIRPDGTEDTVEDVDGNVYETKVIGGQEWMIGNLKTMHFQDGSPIPGEISDEEWSSLETPALGIYDYEKIEGFESDSAVLEAYGALYNWHALVDERGLCPTGWHVPSDDEWRRFEISLGMSESASLDTDYRGDNEGAKIKITTTYPAPHPRWDAGNVSNNSTGFSVIPGGARFDNGNYGYKGFFGYLWTATEVAIDDAWGRVLIFSESTIGRDIIDKNMGLNLRCVKDDH